MKPTTFLRIASIITLLYCAGHTLGMPWTPALGPDELPVIEGMKSHSFDAAGSTRTYWDFYFGFGIISSVYLILQSVVLWQLGSLAKTEAFRFRPIIGTFFVAFVINAILGWMYFFIIPVSMAAAISVCLALAFITASKRKTNL